MPRNRYIFPIALGGSVAIHLASMGAWYAYASAMGRRARPAAKPMELVVSLDDSFDRHEEMGDAKGKGIGSNSSPGPTPLVAPEADEDQALLSRDPVGMGRLGAPPTDYTGPTGSGAGPRRAQSSRGAPAVSAQLSPPILAAPPAAAPEPAPVVEQSPRGTLPKIEPTPRVAVTAPPTPLLPSPVKPMSAALAKTASGDGRSPGLPRRSADPLPQSESDSDAFARISGSIVIRDGRLEVRLGRKVKTTRPDLLLAGQVDLIALNNPSVVLEVHIAPSGSVTDVKIAHSSGSNQIDEPTRVAVYNWWFEPARNKQGQPIPDVIFFTIQYR